MVAVLLTGLLLSITGCRKETSGGVPLTPVDFQINVNNPAYNDLAVPGGWLYLTGGSLGIIVYRKSMEEFVALDRHCPYQPAALPRACGRHRRDRTRHHLLRQRLPHHGRQRHTRSRIPRAAALQYGVQREHPPDLQLSGWVERCKGAGALAPMLGRDPGGEVQGWTPASSPRT